MKDTSVFTPGRSNFGLLLSDSEQSGASDVSDHEEVPVVDSQAVEAVAQENAEEPPVDDEWLPVSHKKVRNPATPKHASLHHREPHHQQHHGKTAFIGNGTKKLGQPASAAHHHHQPVKVAEITAESALELYGFPSKYRTGNLRRFVETVVPTGYRIKWQNDSSCWVVFDAPEMLKKALEELHDESIHVRPFAAENLTIQDEPETAETVEAEAPTATA